MCFRSIGVRRLLGLASDGFEVVTAASPALDRCYRHKKERLGKAQHFVAWDRAAKFDLEASALKRRPKGSGSEKSQMLQARELRVAAAQGR